MIVWWKPSIVGPTYRVPEWALDLYRPIARECAEQRRRAEIEPVPPRGTQAHLDRAKRITDAHRLAMQWRRALIEVGRMAG
jgi:hypothetical protein